MLTKLDTVAAAGWTKGAPLVVAYEWVRNAAYTAGSPTAYTTTSVSPDCI